MNLSNLITVARGDTPADLILKNGRIINTFIGKIIEGNIALYKDFIAGIGDYTAAKEIIDLNGEYVSPGFINGHIHIESSMLHPAQYAYAVVPRGTSTLVTDLHEIANVAGIEGMKTIIKLVKNLPLDMFFMAPSCVPATSMETSGAAIDSHNIKEALKLDNVIGLGEMMNFPGIINAVPQVLDKIIAAKGKVIDGHAPGISGRQLNAYLAAGIRSDHESTVLEEGREKIEKGMYLMIREGSSEKNLNSLLALVNEKTCRRCIFVVDDRNCSDLLREGEIDAVVRASIKKGLDPIMAIQMVTINPAEYFRLYDRGAIAPGYIANIVTLSNLNTLEIDMVFYKGKLISREGHPLFHIPVPEPIDLSCTFKIKPFTVDNLKLNTTEREFPVIEIVPQQIITKKTTKTISSEDAVVAPDVFSDIAKLVVVERHHATGNIGIGLVKGLGLKTGSLASSISHDSHNIIAAGMNDEDIYLAIKEIERLHGGLVVCNRGKVLASLQLPICGLLSPAPLTDVVAQFEYLETAAGKLGNLAQSPFAILSFLALPVIPEVRLTDKGIVDVMSFKFLIEHVS